MESIFFVKSRWLTIWQKLVKCWMLLKKQVSNIVADIPTDLHLHLHWRANWLRKEGLEGFTMYLSAMHKTGLRIQILGWFGGLIKKLQDQDLLVILVHTQL